MGLGRGGESDSQAHVVLETPYWERGKGHSGTCYLVVVHLIDCCIYSSVVSCCGHSASSRVQYKDKRHGLSFY